MKSKGSVTEPRRQSPSDARRKTGSAAASGLRSAVPLPKLATFPGQERWVAFALFAIGRGLSARDTARFADELYAEFQQRAVELER